MTTFQSIIYSAIYGLTRFAPISTSAHEYLIQHALNWPAPDAALKGGMAAAAVLALLIHFRHDWASMVSSFLQVLIFRKKPMTLDERLPFFLILSSIPGAAAVLFWSHSAMGGGGLEIEVNTLPLAALVLFFGLPLPISEGWSKKNRGMFDWGILDVFLVGVAQAAFILPGGDFLALALVATFFRNYAREAAAKYTFYAMLPMLLGVSIHWLRHMEWHAARASENLSWLSFWVGFAVCAFLGTITVGGMQKQIQKANLRNYSNYRAVLAVALVVVYWFFE